MNVEDRQYKVYVHISPDNKKYVGMTSMKPEYRWNSGRGYKTHERFWEDIQKYGWDNFQHNILRKNLTFDEACFWEKAYIQHYESYDPEKGYNRTFGGETNYPTSETRERFSQAQSGENNANYGKHWSDEVKKKISEHHADVSGENNPMFGVHLHEKAPWFGKKGYDNPNSKAVNQYTKDGKYVATYGSVALAGEALGKDPSSISKCCRHEPKYKTAYKYKWEYVNEVTDESSKFD